MASTKVAELTTQLSKKGTFMQAVRQLTGEVTTSYAGCGDGDRTLLFNACKRAFTLLCSRYTAVGFWRVGKDLFAAVVAETASEPGRAKPAKEWLERATEEVSKGEEESKGGAEPAGESRPEAGGAAPRVPAAPSEGLAGRGADELRAVLQEYVREVDVEQLLSLIQLQAGADLEQSGGAVPC